MQKTKKNWALRAMFLALAFTLISTCLLGGTMAKYTTLGSGADRARVAKWGVEISAIGSLFSNKYLRHDNSYGNAASLTVMSSSEGNLVAPGTSSADVGDGTGLAFGITGTPEVACRITFAATGVIEGWDYPLADNLYLPIKWSLTKDGGDNLCDGTFEDMLAQIDALTVDVAPNTNLATTLDGYVITWSWPFAGGEDAGDTYYGNKTTAPTIELSIAITVTQID